MAVWTNPKEDEVEDGETGRVLLCKFVNERFLICIGEFFDVVKEGRVKGVDVFWRDGNMRQEGVGTEEMV